MQDQLRSIRYGLCISLAQLTQKRIYSVLELILLNLHHSVFERHLFLWFFINNLISLQIMTSSSLLRLLFLVLLHCCRMFGLYMGIVSCFIHKYFCAFLACNHIRGLLIFFCYRPWILALSFSFVLFLMIIQVHLNYQPSIKSNTKGFGDKVLFLLYKMELKLKSYNQVSWPDINNKNRLKLNRPVFQCTLLYQRFSGN